MADPAMKFRASMDTTEFEGGAKKLQGVSAAASEGIAGNFKKIALAVVGIGAAFVTVRSAMQSFFAAVRYGGELNDLAARTGETAGNLAILQRAFENAGASGSQVGPTLNRLQRAIVEAGQGVSTYTKAFDTLGLSFKDLERLSPLEQLKKVAEAIAKLPEAQRAAAAMQLLGRSGGELLPLLRAMGVELDRARDQLGSLPAVLDGTNGHLDTLSDNFRNIGEMGRNFMIGAISKIVPGLAAISEQIARIDAAGFGLIVADYIERVTTWAGKTFQLAEALDRVKLAIKTIASGDIGDGLELLFKSARNFGLNAINEILAGAQAGIATIWQTLQDLFRKDGPMGQMFSALFDFFELKMVAAIGRAMSNLPSFLGGGAGQLRAAEMNEETAQMALNRASIRGGQALQDMGRIASEAPGRFETNMANAPRPFDMSDREEEVAQVLERALAPIVETTKQLMEDLNRLRATEPESESRRAKENEIINAIQDLRTDSASNQAVIRAAQEASLGAPESGPVRVIVEEKEGGGSADASETTLQKVASLLESLNTKLPQPVLV